MKNPYTHFWNIFRSVYAQLNFIFTMILADILQFMLFLISAQNSNMKVLILLLGGCIWLEGNAFYKHSLI